MIGLLIVRGIASLLGMLAYALGIRRDVTLHNIALAYPALGVREQRRIARASYRNLAIVFLEFVVLRFGLRRHILKALTITNPEAATLAESEGRGVLILSGHLANWEWIGIAVGLSLDRPIRLVVKNQRSNVAERFLIRMRSRFGNTKVDAGDVRGIFAALRNKEFIAILGDQAAPASSLRVPFFGIEVPTFEGVARLALRSKAPIIFSHSRRTLQGYECTFERILYDDLEESSADAVRLLTARHTAVLERSIRQNPSQWVWQHRRWKDASV